jgi:PadR family transcriptional regulator PadR
VTGQAQLLPDALDRLTPKAVSVGPLHGYGILLRFEQISLRALLIEHCALYPTLFRLVRQGLLKASLGESDNNRRREFYEFTSEGRKRLRQEAGDWSRPVAAVTSIPGTQPEGA